MSENDHRPRVAAERRRKMRLRLLASGLKLGAVHGPASVTIDDVIREAGISRGSFYKYFLSTDALYRAIAIDIANELIKAADPVVQGVDDPAARIANGIRLVSGIAVLQPVVAAFLIRLGWPDVTKEDILLSYVRRDLSAGIAAGRFITMPITLALNIVAGAVLGAANCLLTANCEPDFAELSAAAALRALGLPAKEATEISKRPLTGLTAFEIAMLEQAEN